MFLFICVFVCIYVVIYFRAWYDGCGRENVRIFPGSAPEYNVVLLGNLLDPGSLDQQRLL